MTSLSPPRVQTGLERCLAEPPEVLRGAAFGVLMNQASVDARGRYACDALAERFPGQLRKIFSPQHGLWGEQQANMVESPHGEYPPLGLPVYSLYAETRRPTAEMLAGLECLVIDLQDVGTRIYTFIWTMLECLHACAERGIAVVILDRPNPLGGEILEGPVLEAEYRSFVGNACLPMRHGLTIGELAMLFQQEAQFSGELHVVRMQGWRRELFFEETGLPWIAPSPNMPRVETSLVYPGQVLLEGASLSEGRGTTLPFELCGDPAIDPWALLKELERHRHHGVTLRAVRFVPTFDKHRGRSCGGVALDITSARGVRSLAITVALLDAAIRLLGDQFQWLPPPYEYEREKPPIDILYGSDRLRRRLDQRRALTAAELSELTTCDASAWRRRTASIHLYD